MSQKQQGQPGQADAVSQRIEKIKDEMEKPGIDSILLYALEEEKRGLDRKISLREKAEFVL